MMKIIGFSSYLRSTMLLLCLVTSGLFVACGGGDDSSSTPQNNGADTTTASPIINSFTPTEAKHDEIVTITGTNFGATAGANTATFGGITAAIVTASTTQLTVRVPKNLAALGATPNSVQVTVAGKTATAVARFTYAPTYMVSTFAGDGSAEIFNVPIGVAVDAAGNVYVADSENNRIRKITPAGVVSTLAGDGTYNFADNNTNPLLARFKGPSGVAVDAAGNVYVADSDNHRIRKITSAGVSTLAGDGTADWRDHTSTNPYPSPARFKNPVGVAVDAAGNVLVTDNGNNRIRKITPVGVVSTLAGDGTPGFFDYPFGIVVDAAGHVLVADYNNNLIRKITPAGVVSRLAGDGTYGFADSAPNTNNPLLAKFRYPAGVALDAAGNVLVADFNNNRIRKITPAGVVSTLAGDGTLGSADNTATNTNPLQAQFRGPTGVAADAAGHIYVADAFNNRIRKLTPE
ncbi:MAG: IPT/TIG domain-containing protein [Pseudomonadales bacterium]|jgi:streptogramin lyase|nr:IPT/TIG domain-containing protein [Pseudomonadales bacterium]